MEIEASEGIQIVLAAIIGVSVFSVVFDFDAVPLLELAGFVAFLLVLVWVLNGVLPE